MKSVSVILVAAALLLAPALSQAITAYSQDFEFLLQPDPAALSGDGWVVYGNVFDPLGNHIYGYGTYPAPNDGFGFCQIDMNQGGAEQGLQQLAVFSDYNNGDHAVGNLVESNVFHEQTVEAGNVGETWVFYFDAKIGNLEAPSTALAFIKTLDPGAGWATTNLITADMTTTPDLWTGYTLTLAIDASLVGQLIQFGFSNTATLYASSGVFYDNIQWYPTTTAAPDAPTSLTLAQNVPNPFNPSTRIAFELGVAGRVDLSVYDLAGRLVATLAADELPAGPHAVTWDGRTAAGAPAASGQYRYVLSTPEGRVSRSMVLLK